MCKMNCSDKAVFVPWHSCAEMQTLVVKGTDPRSVKKKAKTEGEQRQLSTTQLGWSSK